MQYKDITITAHCVERYVERILGETNEDNVKLMAQENIDEYIDLIHNLYSNSELIFKGTIGAHKKGESCFYLADNIILVANRTGNKIITLYKVDYGFQEKTNCTILEDLKQERIELICNVEKSNKELKANIEKNKFEIEDIESEIKRLNDKAKILNNKLSVLKDTINLDENFVKNSELEIEEISKKICHSIDYKMDLLRGISSS